MSRQPKPWWNEKKAAWCTDLGGKRRVLAKGKRNKQQAETKLRAILAEQALLSSVGGAITVALLCEKFLADAHENLEFKTYRSYRYGCQKLVDVLGDRHAHTIEPMDINQFSLRLKRNLNDTSRADVT